MTNCYDRQGNLITVPEMMELISEAFDRGEDYRRIAEDYVPLPTGEQPRVSTVWLGVDLNMSREPEPLIFETMCFGGPFDQEPYRWATEEQARQGHAEMVARLREWTP